MSLVAPYLLSRELRNLYTLHPEDSLKLVRWLSFSSWAFASFSLSRPPVCFRGWAGALPQTRASGASSDTGPGFGLPCLRSPIPELTSSQWDYSEWPDEA